MEHLSLLPVLKFSRACLHLHTQRGCATLARSRGARFSSASKERWQKHGDDGMWSQQALAGRRRGVRGCLGENCQLLWAWGQKHSPPPWPLPGICG